MRRRADGARRDPPAEQPPAPKKKGKKKEPVVVVPPKDPTPGTAFLKDLVFRVTEKADPEPGWVPKVWRAAKGENIGIPTVGRLACAYEPGDREVEDAEQRRNVRRAATLVQGRFAAACVNSNNGTLGVPASSTQQRRPATSPHAPGASATRTSPRRARGGTPRSPGRSRRRRLLARARRATTSSQPRPTSRLCDSPLSKSRSCSSSA